jgi:zinc protease
VDKPDAVQTQIRFGRLGIQRNHPDYIPLMVTNHIFGGSYNSRLNTEVRVKKGLTYNASAGFATFLRTGTFEGSTYTRTEATMDAVKLVMEEIAKMATGEVTEEELNVARDFLSGVFILGTETPAQVAERIVTAAFYGLPEDYNRRYPERVRAVTPEQVRQIARKYYRADDLDLVLVGNASAFRDALKQAFPMAAYQELPVGQLDLLASDLRKPEAAEQ